MQYWPLSFRSASISITTEFGKATKHSILFLFFSQRAQNSFFCFTFSALISSVRKNINSFTPLSHESSFWIQRCWRKIMANRKFRNRSAYPINTSVSGREFHGNLRGKIDWRNLSNKALAYFWTQRPVRKYNEFKKYNDQSAVFKKDYPREVNEWRKCKRSLHIFACLQARQSLLVVLDAHFFESGPGCGQFV